MHIKAEGKGKSLAFLLTGGERHESRVFEELMERGTRSVAQERAGPASGPSAWLRTKPTAAATTSAIG